jgi:hypothetical protein
VSEIRQVSVYDQSLWLVGHFPMKVEDCLALGFVCKVPLDDCALLFEVLYLQTGKAFAVIAFAVLEDG